MAPIEELPYSPDTAARFAAFADRPWAVFLDSGRHAPGKSRYDIVAAEPWATLVTRAGMTEIRSPEGTRISPRDPFLLVRELLRPGSEPPGALPFQGGAIGYFGYDLARRLERLPRLAADDEQMPEMAIGIYSWALVVDHLEQRSRLVASGPHAPGPSERRSLRQRLSAATGERVRAPFRITTAVRSNFTQASYLAAFDRIKRYIRDGDCYQVNLAQRFEAQATGDPWSAYEALRIDNPAPFAAYLNLPFAQVLSASPERFLRVSGGRVTTQPIKGTRPRAGHPRLDAQHAEALRTSEKDRAENLMIVDLLRNDLAKSCRIGTVRVPRLFEVQSFASVHHLVSTVKGELAPGRDALDLLRGCFPGGSITGAPKLRAMEIIEELEPHRRGLYCGAIGYVGYDGAMDTSIAIRTLVHHTGHARFWAGGGIVADSQGLDEYQETLDKAAPFLRLMQRSATSGRVP
jgi:para-aminobenzoate synthetase component 1